MAYPMRKPSASKAAKKVMLKKMVRGSEMSAGQMPKMDSMMSRMPGQMAKKHKKMMGLEKM